ncbi:tetratricopeptide repeat protein [Flavobacterium sp. 3HN19-14]|uniref:ATP-binding protein n=1 Tax=Flavobacterium sp. 3HN19-14 TaxID=3448133 RepID=UPI003EE0BF39
MNWKIFIAVVFVVGVLSCVRDSGEFGESKGENDSLDYFFEQANVDTLPYAKRLKFTKKALAIVEKQPNDSMNRVNYFKVANRYWNIGDFNLYNKTVCKLIALSTKKQDDFSTAKAFKYLGEYFLKNQNLDSIYFYYYKSKQLHIKIGNYHEAVTENLMISELQLANNNFTGCEKSLFETLKFLDFVPDDELKFKAYALLGAVYYGMNELEKSLFYHKKSLEIVANSTTLNHSIYTALVLNNVGTVYQKENHHKKAIANFKEGLKNLKDLNLITKAVLYDNLGYSLLRTNQLNGVEYSFYKSLRIRDSLNNIPGIVESKIHLSKFYEYKGDLKNAIYFAKNVYDLAGKNHLPIDRLTATKQLIKTDKKNASKYAQEYYKLTDSLQLTERRSRNKFARIEYETEELAKEKAQLIEQKYNYILTATIVFLVIIITSLLGFLIFKRRQIKLKQQKQKTTTEIYRLQLEQEQKIEEGKQFEKKRIAQELHDGVMGKLASIRLNLFVLNKKSDAATIDKCLEYIDGIQVIEKEIRAIAYDLHNNVSEDLNAERL